MTRFNFVEKQVKHLSIAAIATSLILAAGCHKAQDNDKLDKLAEKLEAMDKKLDRIAAAPRAGAAKRPQRKRPTAGQLYAIPVSDDDAYRGGKRAKVTVVEAYEFACPYCKLIAATMDALLEQYDDEDLKVVSKQFVVHPAIATDPALAACAAYRQGKFEEFETGLWKRAWTEGPRPQLDRNQLSVQSLETLATDIGLDMAKFKTDMTGAECKATLSRNRAELTKVGVSGTPAIYVNGSYYTGPRTPEALKLVIDKEIAVADKALAGGAKLSNYYDELIKKGKPTI